MLKNYRCMYGSLTILGFVICLRFIWQTQGCTGRLYPVIFSNRVCYYGNTHVTNSFQNSCRKYFKNKNNNTPPPPIFLVCFSFKYLYVMAVFFLKQKNIVFFDKNFLTFYGFLLSFKYLLIFFIQSHPY